MGFSVFSSSGAEGTKDKRGGNPLIGRAGLVVNRIITIVGQRLETSCILAIGSSDEYRGNKVLSSWFITLVIPEFILLAGVKRQVSGLKPGLLTAYLTYRAPLPTSPLDFLP